MRSFFSKLFHLPVYIHLLAVVVVALISVYIVLKYLDLYTNHNQAVFVPDVRGLQIDDAIPFFEQNRLRYTIIDSIYSKEYMPGAIVKLTPEEKSKVKRNRFIYITINAKTEESATIPDLKDISFRQAYALLKSARFKDVEARYEPGEFLNATIGVEYNGKLVESDTRVPLTAKLILIVSDGNIELLETDTISESTIKGDESWF